VLWQSRREKGVKTRIVQGEEEAGRETQKHLLSRSAKNLKKKDQGAAPKGTAQARTKETVM